MKTKPKMVVTHNCDSLLIGSESTEAAFFELMC